MDPHIPFCGTPPLLAELWTRWTLHPALLLGLAAALVGGIAVATDGKRMLIGWAIAAALFVSPICAASMAVFSARVGQHILLTLVAAPLIAAALPRLRLPALPMAVVFAGLFWTWHAPGAYAATLQSNLVYWAMHLSLMGAAIMLFAAFRAAPARATGGAAFTAVQLTLYAVLITRATEPWHPWHEIHAAAFRLSALADQRLAGALMWVAGGSAFMAPWHGQPWGCCANPEPDRPPRAAPRLPSSRARAQARRRHRRMDLKREERRNDRS